MSIENQNKLEKITAIGAMLSFVLAAVFVKFSSLSVSSLVNLQNTLLEKALVESGSSNTLGSVYIVGSYFMNAFIALVFLTLAFAFLASYGFYEDRKRAGLVLSVIGGLIFIAFLGFTLASFIVGVGIILSGYSTIPLAHNYGEELKKWIHFRVGSNSISRAHFILNLFIALAIFAAVLANLAFYEAEFKSNIRESISSVVKPSLPKQIDQNAINSIIDQQINSSPLFSAYIRWLPVTSAFSVWVILEFLRLFMPFIAGAFTSAVIKMQK